MSNRLYETRTLQRMSQYVLAQKTGIVQSRISLIENSFYVPKPKEVQRLAKALKVKESDIFPDVNSNKRDDDGQKKLKQGFAEPRA